MPRISFKRFFAALCALAFSSAARADTIALWDGAAAPWTDSLHWSTAPLFPNNSGGNFFDAVINAGAVTLNQNIEINQLALGGGALDGASSLMALEGMQWTAGAIRGAGVLNLGSAGATMIAGGAQPLVLSARTMNFSGSTTFSAGTIRGGFGATINNLSGAAFTVLNNAAFFADALNPAYTFGNAGVFITRSTTGSGFTSMDARFNNTGTVRVELGGSAVGHTLSLAGGGAHAGAFQLDAGTAVELGGSTTLLAGARFTGGGTAAVAGNVALSGNVAADHLNVAVGELNVGGNVLTAGISGTQTGGIVRIASGGILRVGSGSGTWSMDDGVLTGSGTLDAVLAAQGEVAPGTGFGTLSVTGDARFGRDARLAIEIGGTAPGSFDVLTVGGLAFLDGQIVVRLANGFVPGPTATFQVLASNGGISEAFLNAPTDGQRFATADGLGSFEIDYRANAVTLTAFIPEPSAAHLALAGAAALAGCFRRSRRGAR